MPRHQQPKTTALHRSTTRGEVQSRPMPMTRHPPPGDPWFERWLDRHIRFQHRAEVREAFKRGVKAQIVSLMRTLLNQRDDGSRAASYETAAARHAVYNLVFDQLRVMGCRTKSILGLDANHVKKLCRRWENENLASSTINDRLSKLRVFAKLIGKAGMIPPTEKLTTIGIDPSLAIRTSAARTDKSWEAVVDNMEEEFKLADAIDWRFGLMVRLARAFGLRAKEVVMLPIHEAGQGDHLYVIHGTKGKRPREIPIDTPERRALVDRCKIAIIDPCDSMSGKHRKLESSRRWWLRCMEKLGAEKKGRLGRTGHGLRHGYAHEELARSDVPVPVKGIDQATISGKLQRSERQRRKTSTLKVSEAMGHSRTSVMAAYGGAFIRVPAPARKGVQLAPTKVSNEPPDQREAQHKDETGMAPDIAP